MQLKWLEDFTALAQARSFTRAAELRHVTHPAFGRRIRALEAWAGTPLVDRSNGAGGPVNGAVSTRRPASTTPATSRLSRLLLNNPTVVIPPAECPAAAIRPGSTRFWRAASTCVMTYEASPGWLITSSTWKSVAPRDVCG